MNQILLILGLLMFSSCASLSSPQGQTLLRNIEQHYLKVAKKKASFVLDCPEKSLKTQIVSTEFGEMNIRGDGGAKEVATVYRGKDKQIKSIGVQGCSKRILYNLMCGLDRAYDKPVTNVYDGRIKECDLVQEGQSSASHLKKMDEMSAKRKRDTLMHHRAINSQPRQ